MMTLADAALRFAGGKAFWRLAKFALGVIAALDRSAKWRTLAGYARESLGESEGALAHYREAGRLAATGSIRSFRWKHAAQFFLERMMARTGTPRVEDPLFRCAAEPDFSGTAMSAAGRFAAEFVYFGMQIGGIVTGPGTRSVSLTVDGTRLRDINVTRVAGFGFFSFKLTRKALELLPRESTLAVVDDTGRPLPSLSGATRLRLTVPHGVAGPSPLVTGERRIDKKGVLVPTAAELRRSRDAFLAIYADARAFLKENLGKDLFLAYGTLLGVHRQGGFIEGDDDFDAALFADATDPVSVKAEMVAAAFELLKAGFGISLNRRGRLFRLHARGAGARGPHLDVHSFWFQDGMIWAHNDYRGEGTRGDYLPAAVARLEGIDVSLPARPERFLASHYGPGWKTPDPGFINYYASKDRAMLRNLAKALLSPSEYARLKVDAAELRNRVPTAGTFVSIGDCDLYPLAAWEDDVE